MQGLRIFSVKAAKSARTEPRTETWRDGHRWRCEQAKLEFCHPRKEKALCWLLRPSKLS